MRNRAHGSASASGAEVGSQRRGVLGEHPAILQASAAAGRWRSRLAVQAYPRLNHC
jgi:hypothetical protein